MGKGDKFPQWLRNFTFGTYLTDDCVCGSRRLCQSFFCVLCSQDHLCHKQFETPGGLHFGHDRLQVRKGSRRYAVAERKLKAYMDTKLIQKFVINDEEKCFLKQKERSRSGRSASIKDCQLRAVCNLCGFSLQSSATPGAFCSLECLMRGTSPEGSHEGNEKGSPPSSTIKPALQKGPTRTVARKESIPTQEDKLRVYQTPPRALKRKLSAGAGSSCKRIKPAPSPEATPTATRKATAGGPPSREEAKSPTATGREQRQITVSASNLVQGETSAERLNLDLEWLLNATTATLEATVAKSNCSKEEADMLVDDKNVDLLLHFFQHSFI